MNSSVLGSGILCVQHPKQCSLYLLDAKRKTMMNQSLFQTWSIQVSMNMAGKRVESTLVQLNFKLRKVCEQSYKQKKNLYISLST